MREVIEPQSEAVPVGGAIKSHYVAKRVELLRMTICGEPHDLVLVAEFQESEILCHRAVKQPQRMRKGYHSINVHAAAGAYPPHRACKLAESVSRKQRGPFKRRNRKAPREIRLTMLDAVELCIDLSWNGRKRSGHPVSDT